ncbi:carbohydrate porin [Xylophilus rhododendri]|uniref:carbohydrate porin n=1 Tax=Xylophilus rhododendri TaxID=2697032 RepID=UPI001E4CDE6F|nr:carbohydrate porin [Xylophilus rhododendri]
MHGQATYVFQKKPSFDAAYSGVNSLSPEAERSYSFTSTAYLGMRLAPQTELYFNPELVQGLPLSRLTGLGGLTNGELQKTAGTNPVIYRARLFVRHTWGLGGGSEFVEGDANQLASRYDKRRLTLTAGNFAVSDIFDNSAHAHDARTQFLNWSLLTHGAYDFAADSRGYSWGVALEYRHDDDWTLRAGRSLQPIESNGLKLDHKFFSHYGDQVELERRYTAWNRPGTLRLLAFRNVAVMGGFQDALNYAAANGTVPDVAPVRERRTKIGAGINLEQEVADGLGVFTRLARNDGKSETYAFAEIDRSVSFGATLEGGRWGRAQDALGVALAQNGLSQEHRAFLAAGGAGFFVGDGRLNYKPETIAEVYYRFALPAIKKLENAISFGFQHIRNPGYNADRGPVRIFSMRLHSEF